jgi:hypothetical protein
MSNICFILLCIHFYLLFFVHFILAKKVSSKEEKSSTESAVEEDDANKGTNLIRLTKAERRQKFKKEKKEAKKLNKDEDMTPNSPKEKLHSEVLVNCLSEFVYCHHSSILLLLLQFIIIYFDLCDFRLGFISSVPNLFQIKGLCCCCFVVIFNLLLMRVLR